MQADEAVPEGPPAVELVLLVERESVVGPLRTEVPTGMLSPWKQPVMEGRIREEPAQRSIGGPSVAAVPGVARDRMRQLVQRGVGSYVPAPVGDL